VYAASLLQTSSLNMRRRTTTQELRLAIAVSIERKNHRQREQDRCGGLTPIEYDDRLTPDRESSRPTTECHLRLHRAYHLADSVSTRRTNFNPEQRA